MGDLYSEITAQYVMSPIYHHHRYQKETIDIDHRV